MGLAICLAAPEGIHLIREDKEEDMQVTTTESSDADQPEYREMDESVKVISTKKEDNSALLEPANKHSTIVPVYALPPNNAEQLKPMAPPLFHYQFSYSPPNNYNIGYGYVPYTPYYAYTSQLFGHNFFAYSTHHY